MGNVTFLKQASPLPVLLAQPRILTIDVLRGFALFGILYAHMIFWYSGGPLPENIYQTYKDIPSGFAIGFHMLFFSAKFFRYFHFYLGSVFTFK